jgi:hypothetical protein
VTFQNWVDSHTPQVIRAANLARQLLKRKHGITTYRTIPDARYPKQNMTPFIAFVKARFQSLANDSSSAKDKLLKIAAEWKGLSAEERKVRLRELHPKTLAPSSYLLLRMRMLSTVANCMTQPYHDIAVADTARRQKELDAYHEQGSQ